GAGRWLVIARDTDGDTARALGEDVRRHLERALAAPVSVAVEEADTALRADDLLGRAQAPAGFRGPGPHGGCGRPRATPAPGRRAVQELRPAPPGRRDGAAGRTRCARRRRAGPRAAARAAPGRARRRSPRRAASGQSRGGA